MKCLRNTNDVNVSSLRFPLIFVAKKDVDEKARSASTEDGGIDFKLKNIFSNVSGRL